MVLNYCERHIKNLRIMRLISFISSPVQFFILYTNIDLYIHYKNNTHLIIAVIWTFISIGQVIMLIYQIFDLKKKNNSPYLKLSKNEIISNNKVYLIDNITTIQENNDLCLINFNNNKKLFLEYKLVKENREDYNNFINEIKNKLQSDD